MKTFAIFTVNGVEQLGSDAYYRLDSRNALSTMVQDAKERMYRLRIVKPAYNGFNIFKCVSLLDRPTYLYKGTERIVNHAN